MAGFGPSAFVSGWDDDDNEGIEDDRNPTDVKHKEILNAAENGLLNEIKKLVEENPSCVNAVDKDGYTPLHRACYNDHVEIIDFLLSKGANIAAETEDKWQPLHSACRWNNHRCVYKLLEHGADINAVSKGGQTPLHLAASHSYAKETLQVLLLNPQIRTDLRNASNETAADVARRSGQYYWMFEMTDPYFNSLIPESPQSLEAENEDER